MRIRGTPHHYHHHPHEGAGGAVEVGAVVIISECNLQQDNVLSVGKTD